MIDGYAFPHVLPSNLDVLPRPGSSQDLLSFSCSLHFFPLAPCCGFCTAMAVVLTILRWAASLVCFLLRHIMASLFGVAAIYLLTRRSRWPTLDHSQIMSPDTVSSLFPERPIRPLPKRRLRERLSPEVADAIKYPASTLDNVPLFYYPPYTLKEEPVQARSLPNQGALLSRVGGLTWAHRCETAFA